MGYPTKVQLISRQTGQQWYVNFPNALAQALNFVKGETVEWTIISSNHLEMKRMEHKPVARKKATRPAQNSPATERHKPSI